MKDGGKHVGEHDGQTEEVVMDKLREMIDNLTRIGHTASIEYQKCHPEPPNVILSEAKDLHFSVVADARLLCLHHGQSVTESICGCHE